jgi:hypothetical protein
MQLEQLNHVYLDTLKLVYSSFFHAYELWINILGKFFT